MDENGPEFGFYPPSSRELGFGACCILEKQGGRLSFERTAEVLGDFLEIPEHPRSQMRADTPEHTEFSYCLAWACSGLRTKGFMARNQSGTWGECILTEAGHQLGQWAQRVYDGENVDLPDWVVAFLRPTVNRMLNLLKGGKRRKPPDYELCRWVRYCYLLDKSALGVAIFNLILADHVDARVYRQAERQARILRLHNQEQDQRELAQMLAGPRPAGTIAGQNHDEFREWVCSIAAPGTIFWSLVRHVYNQVQEVSEEGMLVLSSKSGRKRMVPWRVVLAAHETLQRDGSIDPTRVAGHGAFVCSLLSRLPGVEVDTALGAVRLSEASSEEGESDAP